MIVKNPVQAKARYCRISIGRGAYSGRYLRQDHEVIAYARHILRRRSTNRLYVAEESKLSDESLLGELGSIARRQQTDLSCKRRKHRFPKTLSSRFAPVSSCDAGRCSEVVR
jgi:hypothetical protein